MSYTITVTIRHGTGELVGVATAPCDTDPGLYEAAQYVVQAALVAAGWHIDSVRDLALEYATQVVDAEKDVTQNDGEET